MTAVQAYFDKQNTAFDLKNLKDNHREAGERHEEICLAQVNTTSPCLHFFGSQ